MHVCFVSDLQKISPPYDFTQAVNVESLQFFNKLFPFKYLVDVFIIS